MQANTDCYSGMITQGPMDESDEAILKLLTDKDHLTSVKS